MKLRFKPLTRALALIALFSLSACEPAPETPRAQGLTSYDRADLIAERAEFVASRPSHKGQQVTEGQVLISLDSRRAQASLKALDAEFAQARAVLDERVHGPRPETIAAARAELDDAQAQARIARIDEERVARLLHVQATGEADLDTARARKDAAGARVRRARARLDELRAGTRVERIAQARAQLASLGARRAKAAVDLQRLTIRAPRDGVVDDLSFELGETPRPGDTVVVMFTGKPWVRAFVPEAWRARIRVGSRATVRIDGIKDSFPAHVRHIRRDADFTPFFALNQRDRARLSYEAEVVLDTEQRIAAGLPASVSFATP